MIPATPSSMTTTTAANIAPVHGGLARPVNRLTPRDRVNYAAWRKLPAVEVNENDQTTLYRIADGTLSPLTGPMTESDYRSSLDQLHIVREGKPWAWSIPIVLPVTVYAFVPGMSVPAIPIVPEFASVLAPAPLLLRLL